MIFKIEEKLICNSLVKQWTNQDYNHFHHLYLLIVSFIQQELEEVFNAFDSNGNGLIDYKELTAILCRAP